MPTYKYLYTCSKTGIKVYTNGICKKIVYPDGRVKYKRAWKNRFFWIKHN